MDVWGDVSGVQPIDVVLPEACVNSADLESWDETGCENLLASAVPVVSASDVLQTQHVLLSLGRAVLDAELTAEQFVNFCIELFDRSGAEKSGSADGEGGDGMDVEGAEDGEVSPDGPPQTHNSPLVSAILDALWVLQLECEVKKGESSKRLVELVKGFLDAEVLRPPMVQERLMEEVLPDVGLVRSVKQFRGRCLRHLTQMHFMLPSHMLSGEEPIGFAKMFTAFWSELGSGFDGVLQRETVQGVMGTFLISPLRVIDAILFVLEEGLMQLANNTAKCIEVVERNHGIFELFERSAVTQVVGFNFQQRTAKPTERSSLHLARLAALLLRFGVIRLSEVMPHLHPSDTEIEQHFRKQQKEIQKYARSMTVVSLNKGDEDSEGAGAGKAWTTATMSSSLYPLKPQLPANTSQDAPNQRYELIGAFLRFDDWDNSADLLLRYRRFSPASHPEIRDSLLHRLDVMISRAHNELRRETGSSKAGKSANDMDVEEGEEVEDDAAAMDDDDGEGLSLDSPALVPSLFRLLKMLGPELHDNLAVLYKVLRVIVYLMDHDEQFKATDGSHLRELEEVMSHSLLPALSLNSGIPAVPIEVWKVLRRFPYVARYRIYSKWKESYEIHPLMLLARSKTLNETRRLMGRLARENIKAYGRIIGKITHSNPLVAFEKIVGHVQSYSNLCDLVVDALKYITDLSHDVLIYTIIVQSASLERPKMDGMNVSSWISSLASFAGMVLRKYPHGEIEAILQYVTNQLKDSNAVDLVILSEIITKMAGVERPDQLTDKQIAAIGGGETLRMESVPGQQAKVLKKTVSRLRDTVIHSGLAVPLFVLMARQRTEIVFGREHQHLKLLSQLFDNCQFVLLQFIEFLQLYVTPKPALAALVPSLDTLQSEYGICQEDAFMISRSVLSLMYSDDICANLSADDAMEEGEEDSRTLMLPIIRNMFDDAIWSCISPEMYSAFWSLSLYDIEVPHAEYDAVIERVESSIPRESSSGRSRDAEKKKRAIESTLSKLKLEKAEQEKHCKLVGKRLKERKDHWLADCTSRNETVGTLLQTCIIPRCVYSPGDALFCSKFVLLVHSLGTPGFSTLQFFDTLLKDVQPLIFSCSEGEAHCFGLYLGSTLRQLETWRKDEALFEKECGTGPGFSRLFTDEQKRCSFREYVTVCYKWHRRLKRGFVAMLESSEQLEIRNVLFVLTKIVDVYPVTKRDMAALRSCVDKVAEETRKDLKLLGSRYKAVLEQRVDAMITSNEFFASSSEFRKELEAKAEVEAKKDAEKKEAQKKKAEEEAAAQRAKREAEKKAAEEKAAEERRKEKEVAESRAQRIAREEEEARAAAIQSLRKNEEDGGKKKGGTRTSGAKESPSRSSSSGRASEDSKQAGQKKTVWKATANTPRSKDEEPSSEPKKSSTSSSSSGSAKADRPSSSSSSSGNSGRGSGSESAGTAPKLSQKRKRDEQGDPAASQAKKRKVERGGEKPRSARSPPRGGRGAPRGPPPQSRQEPPPKWPSHIRTFGAETNQEARDRGGPRGGHEGYPRGGRGGDGAGQRGRQVHYPEDRGDRYGRPEPRDGRDRDPHSGGGRQPPQQQQPPPGHRHRRGPRR